MIDQTYRFSFLSILGFAALVPWEGRTDLVACGNPSETQSISLTLDYKSSVGVSRLKGVAIDRTRLQEIAARFSDDYSAITDTSIMDDPEHEKERVLAGLRKAASRGKTGPILFAYSGHGIPLAGGGWGMILPGVGSDCVHEERIVASSEEGSIGKSFDPSQKMYRGLYSSSQLAEQIAKGAIARALTGSGSRRLSVSSSYLVAVFDDQDPKCAKHILRPAEVRKALGDREVFGLIDACYSGAISSSEFTATLASSLGNEFSTDRGGGALVRKVHELLKRDYCRMTGATGFLNFSSLVKDIPKVLFGKDEATTMSRRLPPSPSTDQSTEPERLSANGVDYHNMSVSGQRPNLKTGISPTDICHSSGADEEKRCLGESAMGTNIGREKISVGIGDGKTCELPAGIEVKVLGTSSDTLRVGRLEPPCAGTYIIEKKSAQIPRATSKTGSSSGDK